MNYTASITDFFKSPKWMMNLLLTGVCLIVPIVGAMVVIGWLVTGLWARQDQRFETFPDFDFSKFSKYLERGLWPVLVTLVAAIGVSIVLTIIFQIPAMIVAAVIGRGMTSGMVGLLFGLIGLVVRLITMVAMFFVIIPLSIRAILAQDFAKAFDMTFIKRFLALTWKETVISAIVATIAVFVFGGVGLIVFCVGTFLGLSLATFCKEHLAKQLYTLYLARGGEPVPVSPKLSDDFSAPPPAAPLPPAA